MHRGRPADARWPRHPLDPPEMPPPTTTTSYFSAMSLPPVPAALSSPPSRGGSGGGDGGGGSERALTGGQRRAVPPAPGPAPGRDPPCLHQWESLRGGVSPSHAPRDSPSALARPGPARPDGAVRGPGGAGGRREPLGRNRRRTLPPGERFAWERLGTGSVSRQPAPGWEGGRRQRACCGTQQLWQPAPTAHCLFTQI